MENGVIIKMKHQEIIGHLDFDEIKKNPNHIKELFFERRFFNFILDEKGETQSSLLLKKKYRDFDAGYLFLAKEDGIVNWNKFQSIFVEYTRIAHKKCNMNFREISLILIAQDFSFDVKEFIKEYNKMYDYRMPIELKLLK